MFDPDLVDSLVGEMRDELKRAIMYIESTGIIHQQLERVSTQLASGAFDEPEPELVERIRLHRLKVQGLRTLQELGQQYRRELSDAEESA